MYDGLRANVLFIRGDYESAAKMYHEGAREGDESASFNYGYCLWRGLGVERDTKLAKSYFAFARDMSGGESCYNLAMLYMHGEGVKRSYTEARRYMEISAARGCIEAQLYLGMAYTVGCMIEPDIIGIRLVPFHKAEYRDMSTPLLMGDIPDADEDEEARFAAISADARAAFEWFRRAAHHDPTYVSELVAKGQFLYAKCYVDGLGTDFNREKGVRLMLAAGKSGSAEAINYLAENGIRPEALLADINRRKSKYE